MTRAFVLLICHMTKIAATLILLILAGCAAQPPASDLYHSMHEHPESFVVVAVGNAKDASYAHAGSTLRGYDSGNRYTQSAQARRTLKQLAREYQLQSVSSWPIDVLAMQCVVFKPTGNIEMELLLTKLQRDPRVMLAQPLQAFATNSSSSLPADAQDPVARNNKDYTSLQNGMRRMDVDDAHRWSKGRGIRVAVIDTGIDSAHPDLQGRIAAIRNFVDADQAKFSSDRHGTAVAGVIAASANNRTGIVGVAPEANLLALKACWQLYANRDDARCNSFTLAQALASAIELHAHVINLSVVGPTDPLLAALINKAQSAGIIVVGAADAESRSLFPARLPDVIGVSAMEQPVAAPQIVNAPGRDVLTLRPGGHYDFSSGSSIATGEVSGAVALLLASHPSNTLSSDQLRQLLLHSTEISSIDKFSSINACVALSALLKLPGCNHIGMESGAAAIR